MFLPLQSLLRRDDNLTKTSWKSCREQQQQQQVKKKKKQVTAMTRRKIPLQQGHNYNKVKQTAVNFQQLRDNEEDDVSKA